MDSSICAFWGKINKVVICDKSIQIILFAFEWASQWGRQTIKENDENTQQQSVIALEINNTKFFLSSSEAL